MALVTANQSLPSDSKHCCADWLQVAAITIEPGSIYTSPALSMPPVAGHGIVAVRTILSFTANGPCNLHYVIGVSNPSEFDYPMRPYTGVSYPNTAYSNVILACTATLPVHRERLDIIDPGSMTAPADFRCWTMNPGSDPTAGRGYPSLFASITNNGTVAVTVNDLQLISEAIQH